MVNLGRGVKLDDSWSSCTPSLDWFKWTTNQNVFSKIYFSDCIKMWKKDEKFFLKIKKKKSGQARFSGTGWDDHQFFFFLRGLSPRMLFLKIVTLTPRTRPPLDPPLGSVSVLLSGLLCKHRKPWLYLSSGVRAYSFSVIPPESLSTGNHWSLFYFQYERGAATAYIARNQALKKLQLTLPDFR
jgi:hypothetical protein